MHTQHLPLHVAAAQLAALLAAVALQLASLLRQLLLLLASSLWYCPQMTFRTMQLALGQVASVGEHPSCCSGCTTRSRNTPTHTHTRTQWHTHTGSVTCEHLQWCRRPAGVAFSWKKTRRETKGVRECWLRGVGGHIRWLLARFLFLPFS